MLPKPQTTIHILLSRSTAWLKPAKAIQNWNALAERISALQTLDTSEFPFSYLRLTCGQTCCMTVKRNAVVSPNRIKPFNASNAPMNCHCGCK